MADMTDRRYTRLFIDNVSSHADIKELEHMFSSIGPVNSFHASHNSGYVEYENPKDAKYAIKKYDSYRLDGKKLGVEYAVKTSNKHLRSRRSEKERDMAQGRCFNCKERGHLARPLLKKGRGSRSRSYSSSSRSRSRGKYHGRHRSKHSRSKSYSSRSYQRSEKSVSKSHSHQKKENGKEKEKEIEKEIKDKDKSEKRKSKKKESSSRSRSSHKS